VRKIYIVGLANVLLFAGCSIFERPSNAPERTHRQIQKLIEKQKQAEAQQSKASNPTQVTKDSRGGKETETQPKQSLTTNVAKSRHQPNKDTIAASPSKNSATKLEPPAAKIGNVQAGKIDVLCRQLSEKLFSLSLQECLHLEFSADAISVLSRPLVHRDFIHSNTANLQRKRVLIIGGIHGDEYSSISVTFKWMRMLIKASEHSIFDWRFLPSANPDGLLRKTPQRQNANNVDLNRNFLTQDWYEQAISKWRSKYNSDPRRFPGDSPASEPEVKWIVQQIADFNPDAIISLHAPYGRVDFDGPPKGPTKLGALTAIRLGVFPGSLGNYSGVDLKIPTVTLELPSADKIPAKLEISSMWQDLQIWLCNHLEEQCDAAALPKGSGALGPVDVVHNR
jgi:hypothetical protein